MKTDITKKNNKALVVVSFGTTFDEALKLDLGGIESALANAFSERDFFKAYTSNIVMKRNKARRIIVPNLESLLETLLEKDYKDILVQPSHLLHGSEFEDKIIPTIQKYKNKFERLLLGDPLLYRDEDFDAAAQQIATQFPSTLIPNEGIVLMGHGSNTKNNKSFGITFTKLENAFKRIGIPVVIGCVEDLEPTNVYYVLKKVKENNYKKVHLYPLLIVSGDHANNDMAGDNENSWKNQLEQIGVEAVCHVQGLGRNTALQELFIKNANRTLAENK